MRVSVDGREWVMSWQHFNHGQGRHNATLCFVKPADQEQGPYPRADGVAECVPQDQYVKAVGRKISLGRALLNLFPDNKITRRAFWEVYLARR